jgi:CRISPR-associated protein Cas5/DevS
MLLSLCGVDWMNKKDYQGIQIALALRREPEQSRIFRKLRRVPQVGKNKDPLTSRRPDYQDLLLWLEFWVWLQDGDSQKSLVERVRVALDSKKSGGIERFGGLSLGESSHLVNVISLSDPDEQGSFLCSREDGFYHLPIWVQHPRCGEGKTRMGRFTVLPKGPVKQPPPGDPRWIEIKP